MAAVYRLSMHRLPDRTSFRVVSCYSFQDFCRTGFALLRNEQRLVIIPDLLAHSFLINDHAAEPIVRHRFFCIIRIHLYGQIAEFLFISLVNRLFLVDVFLQIRQLTANDAGDDVAHPVVVSDFLMLIPWGGFTGLCAPFAYFICIFP